MRFEALLLPSYSKPQASGKLWCRGRCREGERACDTMNWGGRNKSGLCDCWVRTVKKWEAWVYLSVSCVIVCVLKIQYLCWMVSYVALFCALEILTFGKFRREDALSAVSWNGMWSGLMLHFDCSSSTCDCHPLTHTVKAKRFESLPDRTG